MKTAEERRLAKNARQRRWNVRHPEKVNANWQTRRDPEAHGAAQKRWRLKHPEAYRTFQRMCKYGITAEQFDAMLKHQRGRCAICLVKFEGTPHVDHCHETKKVRGLLCSLCNHLLGNAKDSPKTLRAAIRYLVRI